MFTMHTFWMNAQCRCKYNEVRQSRGRSEERSGIKKRTGTAGRARVERRGRVVGGGGEGSERAVVSRESRNGVWRPGEEHK